MANSSDKPTLHVLIADDHPLITEAFTYLLRQNFNVKTLLLTSRTDDLLKLMKENKIDLILLDVLLEDGTSLNMIEHLKRLWPDTKILVQSIFSEEGFGKRIIDSGADGFISKKENSREMLHAIKMVLDGKKYLSEDLVYELAFKTERGKEENPFIQLTSREFEIVVYLLEGLSVGEVSRMINVQRTTVSTHKAKAFEKLEVANLLQLQQLAVLHNIGIGKPKDE